MPNNVIEIVLRAKDQASSALKSVSGSLLSVKGLLAGVVAGAGFRALIGNIDEAQKSALQLDSALKAVGNRVGVTKEQIEDYSSELQRTTTVSDDAAIQASTLAIRMGIQGKAIEQTVRAAADLSAVLGSDLLGATRQIAVALADPERGINSLRRAGVVLSNSEKELAKDFLDVGNKAGAQNIILTAIEKRYKGAAAAAANTLGGALTRLKNSFGDLFEGQGSSGVPKLTKAISGVADALNDPKIRAGIDSLLTGFSKVLEISIKIAANIGRLFDLSPDTSTVEKTLDSIQELENERARLIARSFSTGDIDNRIALLNNQVARVMSPGQQGRVSNPGPTDVAAEVDIDLGAVKEGIRDSLDSLDRQLKQELGPLLDQAAAKILEGPEFVKQLSEKAATTARETKKAISELYRQMDRDTETSLEKQGRELAEFKQKLNILRAGGDITDSQYDKRLAEFVEKNDEAMIRISESARRATESIHDAFTNLYKSLGQGGGLKGFFKQMLETIRDSFANLLATLTLQVLGIEKLMKRLQKSIDDAMKSSSNGSGGGSDFISTAINIGRSIFGFAGGGHPRGLAMVGEDGPELANFGSGGQVWNMRQLAFAGAGGGVSYAPVSNFYFETSANDQESLRREFGAVLAINNAKQEQRFQRVLQENGLGRVR